MFIRMLSSVISRDQIARCLCTLGTLAIHQSSYMDFNRDQPATPPLSLRLGKS